MTPAPGSSNPSAGAAGGANPGGVNPAGAPSQAGTTPGSAMPSGVPTMPAPTSQGGAQGGPAAGGSGGEATAGVGAGGTGPGAGAGSDAGGSGSGGQPDGESPMASGELVGFATRNGGTTGGQAGQTVTVTTYQELVNYAESSDPYVIRIQGTISNGPNGGSVRVASNKSLIGVGADAFLDGVGLGIKSSNNIIIQNLRVSLIGVTTRTDTDGVYSSTGDEGRPQILVNGGDAISISGTSKNIWVDHCELFSEDPDVQTNIDLYDGLIDIKNQTGFITISWCYLHDHHKGGLVGSSDTDLYDDRKITFHHNYYDKVKLRVPDYRGAVGHFFNNYIVGATDASEIRAGTCVRIEKNYYEALHYSIYTSSDAPGRAQRIDNIEVSRTSRAYPDDCTADIPYDYSSALTETTEDVKTVVPAFAGVGKL